MNKDSYLEHIRFIHFSLVILCTTTSYLLFPHWVNNSELVEEVINFRKFVKQAKQDSIPEFTNSFYEYKRSLTNQIQDSLGNVKMSLAVNYDANNDLRELKDLQEDATLLLFRDKLAKSTCTIYGVNKIRENMSDIRSYLKNTNYVVDSISMSITEWKDANLRDSGKITLGIFGTNAKKDTTFQKAFVGIGMMRKSIFNDTVFNKQHPLLAQFWPKLKDKSFDDAQTWANDQPTEEIKSKPLSLFGIEIRPEHFGWIGPILAFTLFIYMFLYLNELKGRPDVPSEFLSPWIGTMKNSFALVFVWLSFPIMAFLSIYLPILKFLQSPFWALFWFLLGLTISLRCVWLSRELASPGESRALLKRIRVMLSTKKINPKPGGVS